ADVRSGAALVAPADLEDGDHGVAVRRAAGLDARLVLAVGVRVRVERDPPRDDFAVRHDDVGEIGAHDVLARTAVAPVDAAPRDLDEVVAAAGEVAVGTGRAEDDVGVRAAANRRRGGARREPEEDEKDGDAAHGPLSLAAAQAAARRTGFSASTREHSRHTVRSSSYGMPARCPTTCVVTARWRCGKRMRRKDPVTVLHCNTTSVGWNCQKG